MSIEQFAEGLAAIIGRPAYDRPFVCDGSPLSCKVFIVGFNPATVMRTDFWSFWGSTGFDKKAWRRAYDEERANAPLKPGKKFRPRVSPTRRVIDQIVLASAVPVLETNLYAAASTDMRGLDERNAETFNYLIESISPRVIVAHGKPAQEAVQRLAGAYSILPVSHLSRGWSSTRAAELGRTIGEVVRHS